MDTNDNPTPARSQIAREDYVVHAQLQWGVALQLVCAIAGFAMLYVAAFMMLGNHIRLLNAEETRLTFLIANLVYWTFAMVMTAMVALYLTHRMAGPAQVIERAVRAMRDGDYGQRLALRPGDYLQSLAEAVFELRDELASSEDLRQQAAQKLAATLKAEPTDTDVAFELLTELGFGHEPAAK